MLAAYRRLLRALAVASALILGAVTLLVAGDVIARNVGLGTLPWVLEVSEYSLPLATFLVAPWLLHQSEHVRIDVLLTALPAGVARTLERIADLIGLGVCAVFVIYGARTALASARQGSMVIKSVVFPEWWLYAPVVPCFALLAVEFVRRLTRRRPARSDGAPRLTMAWWLAATVLFGVLSALFAVGLPAAFAFLGINVVGAWVWLGQDAGLVQMIRNGVASIASFSLTPIPFFVLMGEVLFHTGVALKAIEAIDRVIWRVPGRLSVVAVVAGTVFSAISGSTIATTALLGSLMLPEMLRRGYHPGLAMGPIMAIGGVDMLIPPSALTVLLGSLAGISISRLLVAGILPGILLSVVFVGYIVARAVLDPRLAPAFAHEPAQGWAKWRPLAVHVTPLLSIFLVVIVAMSAGWATPTESAAVGALATVAVAACYRALTGPALMRALLGTAGISGVILFIIVGATTFSQILTFSGATNGMVDAIRVAGFGGGWVLFAMMVILLVLGCFIDQVSMMLITLPFFMPLVALYGFDPVWFGVMFLICMQLGLLTPPFGMLLFTMKSVAPPPITMAQVYGAVTPYVVFGLLMLGLVAGFPWLTTWLPSVLLGG